MDDTSNKIQASPITGHEPRLSIRDRKQGRWHLSLRGLATMLNALPPEAISLDAVSAALHHKEYFVRYNAAKLLSRRADRDARLIMQEALTAGNAPTRASAARFLSGFSWFAAEPLIKQALQDPDSRVREAAIYALCDMRQLNAYQLMVEVLQNEADNVRMAAVWGLRECQDPASIPVLEATLLADDYEVRVKALEIMGMNDLPQAIPVVKNALNDPHPEVKYAATLSWIELAGEKGLPALIRLIESAASQARPSMLKGFFHATNYLRIDLTKEQNLDPTLQALETALADEAPEVRKAAVWPLVWIRHSRATALLKQTYHQEQDDEVKAHILYVTFNLLSEAGDELLADGLQSKASPVREMAEEIKQNLADGTVARIYG
jgi:HEAT repeat protein